MNIHLSRRTVLGFATAATTVTVSGCVLFGEHPELILRNVREATITATVNVVDVETGENVLSAVNRVDPSDDVEWQLDLTETHYRITTSLEAGSTKSREWIWGEDSNYMDIVVWDEKIEYMERAY